MHFHQLVFEHSNGEGHQATITISTEHRLLTKLIINKVKIAHNCNKYFLMTASYLGEGTQKEFNPMYGMPTHQAHNWHALRSRNYQRIN